MSIIVGVDASRNRSGGARTHLINLITEGKPHKHGIREIHVWSYKSLLDVIPNQPWLIKHNPPELERSIFNQMWWQRYKFPSELKKAGCSIVLNTDAGTISNFYPSITMSRDMLSYEPGEIQRFGFSKAVLRLILLRYIQNLSLKKSNGTIFLTQYAADVIQRSCGKLSRIAIIPHGVGDEFRNIKAQIRKPADSKNTLRILYVSHAELYKHQCIVIQAIERLRMNGYDVSLSLVGVGVGAVKVKQMIKNQRDKSDPNQEWVELIDFVPHCELPKEMAKADVFVFASSCENMPNTLVEAMAVGLPIACSKRGPMPEVLRDGGIYFDPENQESIANAVEKLVVDERLRLDLALKAKHISEQYLWSRCADETFSFISETNKVADNDHRKLPVK
ncbi:MAG TPA: glycosyltransferase [Desulfomonilia bacterium]